MKKFVMWLSVILFLLGNAEQSFAYLLPADAIVNYMVKKRPSLSALEVKQSLEFYDPRFPEGKILTKESLYLLPTGEFRVEGKYSKFVQTWVNKGDRFLIITDGFVTDEGRYRRSILREIFVVPEPADLLADLQSSGIDITRVAIGRQDSLLVYIIGAAEGDLKEPQIWLDKENFLPVRLIVKEQVDGRPVRLDVRFSHFGQRAPSWYPGKTEVYFDETLAATIKAEQVNPRPNFPETLFDLSGIMRTVPLSKTVNRDLTLSSTRLGDTLSRLRKQY